MRSCVHCGCTESRACLIRIQELDLKLLRRVIGRASEIQPGHRVACWWVSMDPLVCSNPACVTAHAATTVLARVSRVGA